MGNIFTKVERHGWMSVAVGLKRLLVAAADRQRYDTERSLGLSLLPARSLAMTIIATSKAEQIGRSLTPVSSKPD